MNKAFEYILKGLVGVVLGGQAFTASWYGESMLTSCLHQRHIQLLGPASDELYKVWAFSSIPDSLSQATAASLVWAAALGIMLIAHILYKREIQNAGSRSDPSNSFFLKMWHYYAKAYHFITLTVMVGFVAALFGLPLRHSVVLVLLISTTTSALYLFLYSKDITVGSYLERLAYVSVFVVFIVVAVTWPNVYGRRVFDPEFLVVHFTGSVTTDHCDKTMHKGPVFLVQHAKNGKTAQFMSVCFDESGQTFVEFFENSQDYSSLGMRLTFSKVSSEPVKTVTTSEVRQAIDQIKQELTSPAPK